MKQGGIPVFHAKSRHVTGQLFGAGRNYRVVDSIGGSFELSNVPYLESIIQKFRKCLS
jgi:hypothetical protein